MAFSFISCRLIPEGQGGGAGLPKRPGEVDCHKFHMTHPDIDAHYLSGLPAQAEHLRLAASAGLGGAALLQNTRVDQPGHILKHRGHAQGQRLRDLLPGHGLAAPQQLKNPCLNTLRHLCHFLHLLY